MSKKVAIIDYSLGNLFSVQQALLQCGVDSFVTDKPEEIKTADAIVLPGVGAFAEAMTYLKANKLDLAIKDSINSKKQFLGICLGMQLLFDSSEEFGATQGLGIIPGTIKKFVSADGKKLHVPQVGWNTIKDNNGKWTNSPLKSVNDGSYVYFVHSFYAIPKNNENILSTTHYGGIDYCSSVIKDNVVATQFHPEKSGDKGLTIYENWIKSI